MKKHFFAVILCVGCMMAKAQNQQSWVKPLEFGKPSNKKNNPAYDSAKTAMLNNLYASRFTWPPASYSHSTDGGHVYNLPIDNMPCLAPYNYSTTMPNAKPPAMGDMPNAITPWTIIPKAKPKKKQE
jgi:hypothetical protein